MWERFPIQRNGMSGHHYSTIDPAFAYRRYPDIHIAQWKNVPHETREWALSIWKRVFGCVRTPLTSTDTLAWIDGVGTLVARAGRWMGDRKSKECTYIVCNYVDPAHRNKGIAERMIESICHETGSSLYFFELENVPRSLSDATVFQRFRYAWYPSVSPRPWTRMPYSVLKTHLANEKGFHPRRYAGYIGYESDDEWCILDPYDDIVICSTYSALSTLPRGHYARIPSSYGNVSLFAENLYFDKEPLDVYLLA